MTEFDTTPGPVPSLIVNRLHFDDRGTFQEVYAAGQTPLKVAQVNHSYSIQGTIRGLHWQVPPHAIAKYVTVVLGRIEDVVVDLRRSSRTFGRWHKYVLSDGIFEADAIGWDREHYRASLLVPAGFAHGFGVLSHQAHVVYMQDGTWCREAERSLYYGDFDLGIDWAAKVPGRRQVERHVSEKDNQAPFFKDLTDADLFP